MSRLTSRPKPFKCNKTIPPQWDPIYVHVRSHLGGMNSFSYTWFVFKKWNSQFYLYITQVRYPTHVRFLTSYKQPVIVRDNNYIFVQDPNKAHVKKLVFIGWALSDTNIPSNMTDYSPLQKKWSFPLKNSLVNVTKLAGNCEFVHIYWRTP